MPITRTNAAEKLRLSRNRLLRDFPKGKVPDFMRQHARLMDEYFCNCFETSQIGPRMDIMRNPYVIIAFTYQRPGSQSTLFGHRPLHPCHVMLNVNLILVLIV